MYKLLFGCLLATSAVYGQTNDLVDRIAPPYVKTKVDAQYTDRAATAGLKGAVVLRIVIDRDGIPRDPKFISFVDERDPANPKTRSTALGLDESAMAAVRKWRFSPAIKDLGPVATYATVEMTFHGPEHSPPGRFQEHQ
jgi:outer membrane biosynthesis protein TonB